MSEHMFHTNMKCVLSELMVCIRNILCPNLRYTRKYDFLVQNDVTYDNVICLYLCYPRKYDVFCSNIRYVQKRVMSEHMLHTNMRGILSELIFYINKCNMSVPMLHSKIFLVSELMFHTKICNVRTHVTHEKMMYHIRTNVTYENVICANICFEQKYDVLCPILC